MPTIDVTNPGPIEGTFPIDLGKGPGVYEFRGKRGSGKTTCISSIDLLSGHKVDVTLHDGAASGSVSGFGAVAPIGGRKRRKGEFTLAKIDAEKFSLTDLIDPPGKTPEVRDAHAIKALAVLSETEADPVLYHELAGSMAAFDALGIAETNDPVLLATRVKSVFDKAGMTAARTAEAEAKHAIPLEHVPEGLDMSGSSDLTALGNERDTARDTYQRLATDRANGIVEDDAVARAKERLAKIEAEYAGLTIEKADIAKQVATDMAHAAVDRIEELERELEKARALSEARSAEFIAAARTAEAAKSHYSAVEELQEVASKAVNYPDSSAIVTAGSTVADATDAYDMGVRIHDVKKNHENAKVHRDAATDAEKNAAEARNKASQVFDILAQSLHTEHLEIRSVDDVPRLFVQHPTRGKTLFDRVNGLSDGERVDFTLRELVPHIGKPGMLPIPQRVWQDLQPTDRTALHDLAVDKGLYIFGAQVDDGELRVVFLGDQTGEPNASD